MEKGVTHATQGRGRVSLIVENVEKITRYLCGNLKISSSLHNYYHNHVENIVSFSFYPNKLSNTAFDIMF